MAFAQEFSSAISLREKREILRGYFAQNPDAKLGSLVDSLTGLEDKKICLSQGAQAGGNLSFFERLGLSGRQASVQNDIERMARETVKKALARDEQGRKFPELVMGGIAPLLKKNEVTCLSRVTQMLSGLRESHPVKKIYAGFIQDLSRAVDTGLHIREQGITEDNITKVFQERRKSLSRRMMRQVMQRYLLADPAFRALLKHAEQTLDSLLSDETPDRDEEQIHASTRVIEELAKVRDLESFLKKAAPFVDAGGAYADEVARLFDILLDDPIVDCVRLLKFPLDREMLINWIARSPAPANTSDETARKIILFKNAMEKQAGKYEKSEDYFDRLRLFYAYDISFTDKYAVLSELAKHESSAGEAVVFACGQIKDVQFRIENKFLSAVLRQLDLCFSFSEIDALLEDDLKRIQARISLFKTSLKKNIDALVAGGGGGKYTLLESVVKHIASDKMITSEAFLEIDKKVNQGQSLIFAARLASTLIDFYFLLNARTILEFLKKWFSSLLSTDGLHLSKRLSAMTREEVWEFLKKYQTQRQVVTDELSKYLAWGDEEKKVRGRFLKRLSAPDYTTPEVQAGKFSLGGLRYGNDFSIFLKDVEGKTRFAKSLPGIATYLDFKNALHRFKVEKYVPLDENSRKALFQYIHMEALDSIRLYITERLDILMFRDSVLQTTSAAIKKEIDEADPADPDGPAEGQSGIAAGWIRRGEEEILLRKRLADSLNNEQSRVKEGSAAYRRIAEELADQENAISRINAMLNFIQGLSGKRQDLSKLGISDFQTWFEAHRLKENQQYIDSCIEELSAGGAGDQKAMQYLKSLPELDLPPQVESVFGAEADARKIKKAVDEYCLFHPVHENIAWLSEISASFRNEIASIKSWCDAHGAIRDRTSVLYKKEIEYQKQRKESFEAAVEAIDRELSQFVEVEKLNHDTQLVAEKIMEGNAEGSVLAPVVMEKLLAMGGEPAKSNVAGRILVETEDVEIQETAVRVLEKSSVARFRILAILFRVLDAQVDFQVKLRLLTEFVKYLVEKKPGVYLALKPYLDTQKEKLVVQYRERTLKISDLWKELDSLESNDEKLAFIKRLSDDPAMKRYHPYLDRIRQGLLADNVGEFLKRNNALPVADQLELIRKIRFFGNPAYDLPEIRSLIQRKEMELEARERIYNMPDIPLFSETTFTLFLKSAPVRDAVINAMDIDIYEKEKAGVLEFFRENKIPESEISAYMKTSLASPEMISRFTRHKQQPQPKPELPQPREQEPAAKLVSALEAITSFTGLEQLGSSCGFDENEIKRLPGILSQFEAKGYCLFLPAGNMLLGRGKFKELVHRAYNEMLSRKAATFDYSLMADFRDHIKSVVPDEDQCAIIGVENKDEQNDLWKELDGILNRNSVRRPDVRKKIVRELQNSAKEERMHETPVKGRVKSPAGRLPEKKAGSIFGQRRQKAAVRKPVVKKEPVKKEKPRSYSEIARKYVSNTYAPLVTGYIKRMYKAKSDFFIPLGDKRQYYTLDVLANAIEGILRKDISGNSHLDLLDSLKSDKNLFPIIITELFETRQDKSGQSVYFPRFLKGDVKF